MSKRLSICCPLRQRFGLYAHYFNLCQGVVKIYFGTLVPAFGLLKETLVPPSGLSTYCRFLASVSSVAYKSAFKHHVTDVTLVTPPSRVMFKRLFPGLPGLGYFPAAGKAGVFMRLNG